jgi:APA family basic amino acid/polyamine antiporter
MSAADGLTRTLTFPDLLAFGIASIMGSGGFNLISEGVKEGGPKFPAAIALVTALFQGASKVYSEAYAAFKSNTSESDVVKAELGGAAHHLTAISITGFNILSISTILVFAAKTVFPAGKWYGQIGAALLALGAMAAVALKGIEVNKAIITFFSALIVALLAFASTIGLVEGFGPTGTPPDAYPAEFATTHSFTQSVNYFYFVLAGFDLLMKFVGESKTPDEDIPKSFYVSNAASTLLTVGVAYAYVHTMTLKSTGGAPGHNAIGLIIESALGKPAGRAVFWLSIFLMIITAFVAFLGTTRYLYGLAEEEGPLKEYASWLKDLSAEKVPWKAVLASASIAAVGILVNHTSTLVNISDTFLTITLAMVSAAVTTMRWRRGEAPWVEGATTLGFLGILSTCCFP